MRAGRKSLAQTPAPVEDRVYGSSVNAPNSATKSNADKIVLSDGITNTLRAKLEVFLKDNPDQKGKITLADLKAVFRRGAGAYSKSHRPTITGGVPNSRNAWAYARVNKFLQKAGGMKVKKAYIQDDDLMKFEHGGETPIFGSVENSPYRGFTEEEVMAYDFPEIYKIAEKHHIGSKTIHTEFIKGVFHEQEHTSDWGLSAHTSLQHLWEVPDYYTKLDAVKLAKGGKVKQAKGDCYETSGRIAIDGGIKGIEFVGKPYLVQAEVRGQGDLMGVRFGHSWIEDDEFVYDYSNGKELKIPKVFYYYLGDIQTIEPRYYRYTFAQAKKKMIETGHFGSWELETESGL